MTVRGNHESSTLSLRAIFMLKRAFARFKVRKAAKRAAAATGSSSRLFSSRPTLVMGVSATTSPSNSARGLPDDPPNGNLLPFAPAQASRRTLLLPHEAHVLPVGAFTEDATTTTTTTSNPQVFFVSHPDASGIQGVVVTGSDRSLGAPLEAIVEEVVEGHDETHEESRAASPEPVVLVATAAPEGGASGNADPFVSPSESGVEDVLFPEPPPPLLPSPSPLGSDDGGGQTGDAGGDGEYTSLPIQSEGEGREEYGGEEDNKAPELVGESGDGGSARGGSNGEEGAVALPIPPVSPPSTNFPSARSLSKGAAAKAPPAKTSTTASASGGAATGKGRVSARALVGGGGEASKPPPGGVPKSGGLPFRSKRNLGYAKM
jgi:hypothetical protein